MLQRADGRSSATRCAEISQHKGGIETLRKENGNTMAGDYSLDLADDDSACLRIVHLPVALYISDGLIFELYDGGRPMYAFSIHWERVKPLPEHSPENQTLEVKDNAQMPERTARSSAESKRSRP